MKIRKLNIGLITIILLIASILGADLIRVSINRNISDRESNSQFGKNLGYSVKGISNSEIFHPTITPVNLPLTSILPTSAQPVAVSPSPSSRVSSPTPRRIQQQNTSALSRNTVYTLINDYRASRGLTSVQPDSRLEESSYNKAMDMVSQNYFDHGNPWSFINSTGYNFDYAAENLAVNYFTSSSLVEGWENSPAHNQAMLDERNQHMGFSYICDAEITQYEDTCLSVIHFAREME